MVLEKMLADGRSGLAGIICCRSVLSVECGNKSCACGAKMPFWRGERAAQFGTKVHFWHDSSLTRRISSFGETVIEHQRLRWRVYKHGHYVL